MAETRRAGAWAGIALLVAFAAFAALAAGCSNGGSGGYASDDASTPAPDDSGEDASLPAVDAGPLWQSCNPVTGAGCPAGLECFGAHTAPVDAYGTCVFTCAGSSGPSCTLSGGTCACPLVGGGPGDCSEGNDAGAVTVCVPAGDVAVNGTNEEDASAFAFDAGVLDASKD